MAFEFLLSERSESLIGQEMFKVLEKAKMLERQGNQIFHLELGDPHYNPPKEVISETIKSLKLGEVGYTSSAGIDDLRAAIAKQYSLNHNKNITKDRVVISTANFLITQFLEIVCNKKDSVVIFTPAFPTYLASSNYIHLKLIDIPLQCQNGFDLTFESVDLAIKKSPKVIIVNSANNPTGAVYRKEVLEYLAKKALEHNIYILSDETYAELSYNKFYYSLLNLNQPNVLVISSFSKVFSIPGFRVGFAIGHKKIIDKLILSNSTLFSCLPIFTQKGCLAAVRHIKKNTFQLKKNIQTLSSLVVKEINRSKSLRCSLPDSAFYLFIDISKLKKNDIDFCHYLLTKHHVAVTAGRSFGKEFSQHIRISICGPRNDVLEGVERLIECADKLYV
jgi:aspartate/methionine/tyrosine aminotransferase